MLTRSAYTQELAAGKTALEAKVSELLTKGKTQSAKTATMEKELERSKALAVNLTKELQVTAFGACPYPWCSIVSPHSISHTASNSKSIRARQFRRSVMSSIGKTQT
jgi:hypothetical protein